MSETYSKNFLVSWEEFHRDARALAWRLHQEKTWEKVIAITRGGLVPAAIVARELDIRLVDTICISSYEDKTQTQGRMNVLKGLDESGEGCLVIDDLVDTGSTGQVVREMLPKAHFATVYAKPAGLSLVDTYVTQVSQDTWIRFPWDMELNFSQPIADRKS